MSSYVEVRDGIVPSVCSLDCPDQCGLLLYKENGKIVKIEGDPNHPVTKGAICNKVRHMSERIYDHKRLTHPLLRTGKKGDGKFKQITWDEAISIIHQKWITLIQQEGPESILPHGFYGNMGRISAESMDRRFFHRLGASRLDQTVCSAAGTKGYGYTMGGSFGTDPEDTVHTKLFIFWGVNAVSTNMHQVAIAQEARKKHGAKIVVIDVHQNQTGRWADWFIPILPGTDGALALGLMHILCKEELTDETFLEKYTTGYDSLREHVKQYDPETVAQVTGIPAEDMYKLARLYGTTAPSFIRIGNGLQHHDNGGMSVRTIACLPALTGQWQYRGGGAIKGNSGFLAHNTKALQRPDLLEKKETRIINMNQLGKALLLKEQPIRSLFVYNSNPAIITPDGNKVRQGLMREDLFTVVHDLFLTETAKLADLVLPATSSFENTDLYTSYWHHYAHLQEPVIAPYGQSKSNPDLFRLLAAKFGFEESCFEDTDEMMIAQALDFPDNRYLSGITLEKLKEEKFVKAKRDGELVEQLSTISGKIELFSKSMERAGHSPLPTYEPINKESDYPFLFVPAPNHNFLNSTFSNNEKHVSFEKSPKLHIHYQDAEKLGIKHGDDVKVYNDRGSCVLVASVGEAVLQGVVVSQGLWADDAGGDYFVNSLTSDRLSDMGGGATFFSGRVDIEKVTESSL